MLLRLSRSQKNIGQTFRVACLPLQPRRPFLSSLLGMTNKTIDASDKSALSYVKLLVSTSPRSALKTLEEGWANGKIPFDEVYLREYFKACGELKQLDKINISALLSMLKPGAIGTDKTGASNNSMLLTALLNNKGSVTAGTSPQEPMYISPVAPSLGQRLLKLGGAVITTFLLFTLVSSFVEERGGARGMGLTPGSIVHIAENPDKSFDDVVGVDEAKTDLEEIVMYLKEPARFTRLGGKLPKGVLLTGPPGTGKTLLARAIAGEAGVPFFFTSGSEFEEMFVGVGSKRVRDLFEQARKRSPCIIFIDEIDAIGGSRHLKDQSAMKMTLNQLLVEMDGFDQTQGVIVIAATNFPQSLDKALTRPGRFDKHVNVPMPDLGGRKKILELYAKKIPLSDEVSLEQLARGTPGFSGAELFNLMNQAAVKSSVEGLQRVTMSALEYAKDKIMMGAERKSAVMRPESIRMTAYHEGGHALVALKTDGADPVHKATVMPRGGALGMVMQLPDGDQTSITRKEMLARMDVCMGGRVAEELIFGTDNVSSGASSDIEQATKLAYAMVTKYGLSTKVGVMYVDDNSPKISEETKQLVEAEVRRMLDESYKRATKLLETNRKDLEVIANGLIQYETLSGGEIVDLLAGKKVDVTGIRNQRPSRALKEIPLPPAAATTKSPAAPSRGGSPPVQPGKPKIVPSKSVAAPTSSSPSSTSSNSKIVAPVTASATAPLPVVAKDASGATTVKQSSSTATTSKQSSVVEPPPDSKVK